VLCPCTAKCCNAGVISTVQLRHYAAGTAVTLLIASAVIEVVAVWHGQRLCDTAGSEVSVSVIRNWHFGIVRVSGWACGLHDPCCASDSHFLVGSRRSLKSALQLLTAWFYGITLMGLPANSACWACWNGHICGIWHQHFSRHISVSGERTVLKHAAGAHRPARFCRDSSANGF
jgi:hypothetical protein